jgi:hypothetical protein
VLRAEIGLDIGRIAAVLVGRGEQILLPKDAIGLGELFTSACGRGSAKRAGSPASRAARTGAAPVRSRPMAMMKRLTA